MKRVRVLVVDDSPTMRGLIAAVLRQDGEIDVVGQVGDAPAARQALKALDPDVVTLDVEMPGMSGLAFLEKVMRLRPTPVVMVSAHTRAGSRAALEALTLGAVACVPKPVNGDFAGGFADLAATVKAAASARLGRPGGARPAAQAGRLGFQPNGALVAIGASAGGVEAIHALLAEFPDNCPPTVIAQHMPAHVTGAFAERLDQICAAEVVEATDGEPVRPGRILIAPGASHMQVAGIGAARRCRLLPATAAPGARPSVDVLFESVARTAGAGAVGVILSGIGDDGARGLKLMRDRGARTLAQDEASCVIYGMPRAAGERGGVEREAPLDRLASEILRLCDAGTGGGRALQR